MQSLRKQAEVSADVAKANIAVLPLPQTNLFLQGRDISTAPLVWDMLFEDNNGGPICASEKDILLAKNLVADHTEISASFTGTAGLAGLLAAKRDGCIDSDDSVMQCI